MTRLAAVAMVGVLVGCSPQPDEKPPLIRYPPDLSRVDPRYHTAAIVSIDKWWAGKNWIWCCFVDKESGGDE